MKIINVFLLVMAASVLVACGGAEERKAVYMANAEKSIAIGDFDKARIELKNVLQIDPKESLAYFKLGKIFEGKKDFMKAFRNFQTASEFAPDNLEYQAKIGQYYLLLAGDLDKAKEIQEKIKSKDANDIHGLMLGAGIMLREGKTLEAKKIAVNIFGSHPESIENGIFLASIYGREKEYDKAINVLDTAIKHNPDNNSLLSTLATTLFINKDYERTEQVLKGIKNSHPEVLGNHFTLAIFYQRTDRTADAKAILEAAIKLDPEDVSRKTVLIEFVQQTESNANAISLAKQMINSYPSMGQLRNMLGQAQIAEKDFAGAKETYLKAVKDFSVEETGIKSRIALAALYIQDKNIPAADKVIQDALAIAPNDADVNLVNAKISLFNKNYEQAIISLRTVTKDKPENIEAYFMLAAAHNAKNEKAQADQVITRAYENNRGNVAALLPLARYHLSNKNISEAEKIADDYLKIDKSNYDMLSIKAAILNGSKKYEAAYDVAEQLVSTYPEKDQGYVQSIPYLLVQKKTDEAIAILKTGHEKTNNLDLFKMLAEVQIRSGKSNDAIAGINTQLEKSTDEALYLLLANGYMANKDIDNTKQALTNSIKQDANRDKSYLALAKLHIQNDENDKAVVLLKEGLAVDGEHLELGLLLAGLYEKNKNYDAAISQYNLMLDKSSDNIFVINNLAALLSEYKTDEASLKQAKTLADKIKDSTQPVIKDTVGWVYYKTGNYTEAVAVLQQVVDAAPDSPVFNYHLGMAYYKTDNKDKAKTYLQKSVKGEAAFSGIDDARKTLNLLK